MNKILICKNYNGFDFLLKVSDGRVIIHTSYLIGSTQTIESKNIIYLNNNYYYVVCDCDFSKDIYDNLLEDVVEINHKVYEDVINIEILDYIYDNDREIIQSLKTIDIQSVVKINKNLYIELLGGYND